MGRRHSPLPAEIHGQADMAYDGSNFAAGAWLNMNQLHISSHEAFSEFDKLCVSVEGGLNSGSVAKSFLLLVD